MIELVELALMAGEVVFEVVAELATDATVSRPRTLERPRRSREPIVSLIRNSPATYAVLGAALGGVSLWLWPNRVAHAPGARLGLVFITTMVGGAAMSAIGQRRDRAEKPRGRLATFGTGALFALAYASVRAVGHWLSS